MLPVFLTQISDSVYAFTGILFAFVATVIATAKLSKFLPKDAGREFAHDGKLSAGKPRGAGIIFVLAFVAATALFVRINAEFIIYLVLITVSMLTGYLDDRADNPWGEYKKGFLDLLVSLLVAWTFLKYNSNVIQFAMFGTSLEINPIVFGLLTVILVWTSVNVTNCSDGVDGLSGSLTIVTLGSIFMINQLLKVSQDFSLMILIFIVCILGYLWFNATPSKLMMGDAGSRAMGLFISIAILKTGAPLLYIPVAIVLILDGGLGLVKVALLRFLKIKILTKVRTPLHDHVRKIWGWSNTQCVFRFVIIQAIISLATIYGIMI